MDRCVTEFEVSAHRFNWKILVAQFFDRGSIILDPVYVRYHVEISSGQDEK
jgi:hypothetical protein